MDEPIQQGPADVDSGRFSRRDAIVKGAVGLGALSVASVIAPERGVATVRRPLGRYVERGIVALERPPVFPSDAASDYGRFLPAMPEPGTAIPQAQVKFGIRPYADNCYQIIAVQKGWFKDVGITVVPKPYGIKDSSNAIALMANNQVSLNTMSGTNMIPTLNNIKTVKQITFTDDFLGFRIFADPKLKLKTVDDYLKQGLPLKQALNKTLAPFVSSNRQLLTDPLVDTRPFINVAFQAAGYKAPSLLVIADAKGVVLCESGKEQFICPAGGQQIQEMILLGWTELVTQKALLQHAAGSVSSPFEVLVQTVGLAGNSDYINANQNAVLRFISSNFRLVDAVLANPSILRLSLPFLNAFAGTTLDLKGLQSTFANLDPLRSWKSQRSYWSVPRSADFYKNWYGAVIKQYAKQGVVSSERVPDDVVWGSQIYHTLKWYETRTNELLAKLDKQKLSGSRAALRAKAHKYRDWYDFLDSYRLAVAASS